MTPEDRAAARALAEAGVPLFMAAPDPTARLGYRLPMRWEREAAADPCLVDSLPDGWALCAVMGHGLDLVDLDPRNGPTDSVPFALPPAVLQARTPSGGTHLFVLSLGLPSLDGVAPGVDYKGGTPAGEGRGFAFIAPTVRPSKVDGRPRAYEWLVGPRRGLASVLANGDGEPGLSDPLRVAILARREARAVGEARTVPASVARREWSAALDRLTEDVRRWAVSGWGGEAHAGLLAHTTHLARLWPDGAAEGFRTAFERAGQVPDDDDVAKLESALNGAVPDVVVPDADLSPDEAFWLGAVVPDPPREAPAANRAAGVEPAEYDDGDPMGQAVAAELFRHEVRERVRAVLHERSWREPPSYGPLAAELGLPDDAPAWRVSGLLGAGHNAVLVAGRKAGKTTMVVDLVRALVDHEPFLGSETVAVDGGVALFNYELTERQQRDWLRDAAIRDTARVHVLHLRGRSLPLASPQIRAWVVRWLRDRQIRVWVVDPYSRAYVGSVDNGNDEAQVGTFLDYLDQIKHEAGVTELVMPVHAPKAARWDPDALSAIGSQRLEAWPDAIWYLSREGDSEARYFRAEGRDVLRPEGLLVRSASTTDGIFGPLRLSIVERTTATTKVDRDLARMVDFIRDNPGKGTNRLEVEVGFSHAKTSRLLTMAEDEGMVYHVTGDNRSKLWHVVDGGPSGPRSPADHV